MGPSSCATCKYKALKQALQAQVLLERGNPAQRILKLQVTSEDILFVTHVVIEAYQMLIPEEEE